LTGVIFVQKDKYISTFISN